MPGIIIQSSNFNGQSVQITFSPFSGGSINLGTQTIPYTYTTTNYEGDYSIYIPSSDKTCSLQVGTPPSPTPTTTPTETPTNTPTQTPTNTPTLTPTNTPTPTIIPFDPDAAAYLSDVITSGGTIDATISAATNTLFTSLKSAGLYSKMLVMYPFVGGTSGSHAINATLNKTFDITWYGGMVHNISGSTSNGSNSYGDTHFRPGYFTSQLQVANGYYIVKADEQSGVNGGFLGGGYTSIQLGTNFANSYGIRHGYSGFETTPNSGFTTGSFNLIRTGSTEARLYNNSIHRATYSNPNGTGDSPGLNTYYIFNMYGQNFITKETQGFAYYANNISYSEVSTLDNIINTFQTSLGRNTY